MFILKVIQKGIVPSITYRFRTKGLQWIWIQTRFQMLTNQLLNSKPYAIRCHNEVIGLNEILSTKDILDTTSSKAGGDLLQADNILHFKNEYLRSSGYSGSNISEATGEVFFDSYNQQENKSNFGAATTSRKTFSDSDSKTNLKNAPSFNIKAESTYHSAKQIKSEPKSERQIDESLGVILFYIIFILDYF